MWKANGKTTTLVLFWTVSFQKQRYTYTCEMLPLETKQSGDKLLPHSDLQGGCFYRKYPTARTTARVKRRRNSTATRLERGM